MVIFLQRYALEFIIQVLYIFSTRVIWVKKIDSSSGLERKRALLARERAAAAPDEAAA